MLTPTVTYHWSDTKLIHVVFSVVATGNYVTGGDTLNFSLPLVKSASAPIYIDAHINGAYMLIPIIGSSISNSLLKFIIPNTGAELAAGAYPGGITGTTILVYAIFPKFQ